MKTDLRNQRIDKVIASIRGEMARTKDVGFQMSGWIMANFHPGSRKDNLDMTNRGCGTVACIAGHAAILSGISKEKSSLDIARRAAGYLGLSEGKADDLFLGKYIDLLGVHRQLTLHKVKPKQAIRVLEHLKNTGTVDWSIIL